MKKIIKVLRGVLVKGEDWSKYQNETLKNINGGGG
jgi:hypothetical protein